MTAEAKIDAAQLMSRSLSGACLNALERPAEGVWQFDFVQAGLTIECPWRVVAGGVVVLGGSDHGHKFGLPEPVDVIAETLKTLGGKRVKRVEVDLESADLRLIFEGETRIDAFNNSGGYESWTFGDRVGLSVIACGGGKLAIWASGEAHSVQRP